MTDRTERHLWAAKVEWNDGDITLMAAMLRNTGQVGVVVMETRRSIIAFIKANSFPSAKKITPFKFYPWPYPPYGGIGPEKKK